MPTSEKQIEANRRNSQSSTGPRSAEGKSRIRLNALRHGITAHVTVMTEDDRAAHDLHCAGYLKSLNPETPMERDLAEGIAEDAWRLKHARAMDQNLFALAQSRLGEPDDNPQIDAALCDAQTFLDQAPGIQLLTLYEQRLQRAILRNHTLLRELQTERIAARDSALHQAKLHAQLSYAEGRPYQPQAEPKPANGFVFSSAEVNADIRRERRFNEAFAASDKNWDLTKVTKREYLTLIDAPPDTLAKAA